MSFYDLDRTLPGIINPAELFELTDEINTLADPVLPAEATDLRRQLLGAIAKANITLGSAIGRDKGGSPFTELFNRFDRQRDVPFSQLSRRVALTLSDEEEDPAVLADARLVDSVLDDHPRDLHRKSGPENTAELKLLLPKLRQPEIEAALTRQGWKKYVDRMETANNGFDQTTKDAAKASQEGEDIPLTADAEREARWLMAIFLGSLNFGVHQGDAAMTTLTGEIDAAITRVRKNAKARETKSASAAAEAG